MSGGVDSSVAAAILKNQGYEVFGVFMQFWFPVGLKYGENTCCSLESFNQALEVADILGIKLYKLNVGQEFKDLVVDEFLAQYRAGRTPNPCVSCNKFIKFDLLLKKVRGMFDADYLATGHYVIKTKKQKNKKTVYDLLRGKDVNKDQSYFLYNLNQKNLKYLLFPVGDYSKFEVRKMAKKFKLPVHDKHDSQEICFVGNSHYEFLNKYLDLQPGEIINESGGVLGQHGGLPFYTIGQRSGLGLSGGPWYVVGFDYKKNQLLVTKDQKQSEIFGRQLICHKVNWVADQPDLPIKCRAQIRYRGAAEGCVVEKSGRKLKVSFSRPQRAIAPGQSVVFYQGQKVLGGGVIN